MRLLGKILYYIIIIIIYTLLIHVAFNKYVDYKTKYVAVTFGNMVCKCVKVKDYYECTPNNCVYFEIKPNESSEENEEFDIKSSNLQL